MIFKVCVRWCVGMFLVLALSGCGSMFPREETWNSYYYGSEIRTAGASVAYDSGKDIDNDYRLPKGYGQDYINQGGLGAYGQNALRSDHY